MKVRNDKWENLRGIFLESVESADSWESVVRVLAKELPKQQLANIMYEHFYEVFDYCFEEDNSDEALVGKLNDAWVEVGLADFGIPCFNAPSNPTEFYFLCDDMEILFDEATSKMNRFVRLAEGILGFSVEYEFDDVGTEERLGEISHVEGKAK